MFSLPPIIVHLVDAIDQDEPGLREIVGGGHDEIPHPAGRQRLVDLARHQSLLIGHVAPGIRPFAPDEAARVLKVRPLRLVFVAGQREREPPFPVALHRLHELVRHQQRQIELAQPAVLALGADELEHVRMTDIEGSHLRSAAAAGRGDREAHLVVDIHERQRSRCIGTGAAHVGTARTQGRELVADAAARLQGEARLVHLVQDVVHRIADGARDGAVDGGGRGLVLERAGVGGHAARRNRSMAQCPQERLVPLLAQFRRLHVRERARHALVRVVHRPVDRRAVLRDQAVLLVPDVV